jgi:FtsP/CotA-like multicopper oxidase with cupredoxin domain
MRRPSLAFDRRRLLQVAAGAGAASTLDALLPGWAQSAAAGPPRDLAALTGPDIALSVGHIGLEIDGRMGHAVAMNGTVPAPLIRLKQDRTPASR